MAFRDPTSWPLALQGGRGAHEKTRNGCQKIDPFRYALVRRLLFLEETPGPIDRSLEPLERSL